MIRQFQIVIYPILQAACFVASWQLSALSWIASASLLLLAAAFMCFTLHISVHEVVHHWRWTRHQWVRRPVESLLSCLIGLPYNIYRLSHWNHHRYNNQLDDFTSTWKLVDGKPAPRNRWTYTLLWIFNNRALFDHTRYAGETAKTDRRWVLADALVLLAFIWFLFMTNITLGLLFLALNYFGWVLIFFMNYGQHPPVDYDRVMAVSHPAKAYNLIFFNNGLHHEHHVAPSKPIRDLVTDHKAHAIKRSHLLHGLLHPDSTDQP